MRLQIFGSVQRRHRERQYRPSTPCATEGQWSCGKDRESADPFARLVRIHKCPGDAPTSRGRTRGRYPLASADPTHIDAFPPAMSYRREDIENAIWDDEDFDALSNDAALLYLWSFTNPRCGMSGVYRVKRRHICEGRLTGKRLDKALAELAESRHVQYIDGVLWVRTRVKHLRTKGEPMQKSILKDLKSLPSDHPIRDGFCGEYEHSWAAKVVKELNPSGGSQGVPENGSNKPDGRTPSEPPEGSQGRGRGSGSGSTVVSNPTSSSEPYYDSSLNVVRDRGQS